MNYEVTIKESSRQLTAKEKLAVKDMSNATQLDAAIAEGDSLVLTPAYYVILSVHNERSKNEKDYTKYMVIDSDGNKYVTGSESFFTSFKNIFETMQADAPEEEYSIECFRLPSKNYAGKSFLTCSIV